MKALVQRLLPLVDIVLFPLAWLAGVLLGGVRVAGVHRLPACRMALRGLGVFPIRRHYYEPLFHPGDLRRPLADERDLPGIDWNLPEQLDRLVKLDFSTELADWPDRPMPKPQFHFNNGFFESGDAEYWYSMVRRHQPKRIVEIGSGYSTLVAVAALAKNRALDAAYACRHVCIEPYEQPWLEGLGVEVIRKRVEELDLGLFTQLEAGDFLFIDSSHVIRPQGDVIVEYLQLLPRLQPGVIVHIHDIFTPRDYPKEWVVDEVRLWNEQYLLEAFLTHNRDWKVIGALNLLHHRHSDALRRVCPYLASSRDPGSFYLERVGRPKQSQ